MGEDVVGCVDWDWSRASVDIVAVSDTPRVQAVGLRGGCELLLL